MTSDADVTGAPAPSPSSPIWLTSPHHDGSSLYVSSGTPRLGEVVTVWLRVPRPLDPSGVHVRTVIDGEQAFVGASVDRRRTDRTDTWWRARLTCHNPVTSYRWILDGGPTGYAWVNGTGVHLRDVPDASDFRIVAHPSPPPDWAADAVVYQVIPDRFAKSRRSVLAAGNRRPLPEWAVPARWTDPIRRDADGGYSSQLFGGDLDGITEHLDHVQRLGADVVYLTPFFPSESNHRYDASSFDAVDPVLGGDEALRRLTEAAHQRGMRVLGDVTTNHTGDAHPWFVTARDDPASPERDFYFWTSPDAYIGWLGVASLPKLNYESDELRHRFFDDPRGVTRRWLGPDGGLDGWRVDVANMTGRRGAQERNHEVAAWMRDAVADAHPNALLVGEHTHDYSLDVPGDGWHGVMNYAGFTRPVWTWLCDSHEPPGFLGAPVVVPRLGGAAVAETMREFTSHLSWQALAYSFNLVGSHDTTRIRSLVARDPRLVEVAVGLLLTTPSVPMITYGDEIGMEGRFGEDGRKPMPWDERRWDHSTFEQYRGLVSARRASPALRRGGLRWVSAQDDALVYLREAPGETALVHVARGAHKPVRIESDRLPGIADGHCAFGPEPEIGAGTVALTAGGPQVTVWVWSPTRGQRRRARTTR